MPPFEGFAAALRLRQRASRGVHDLGSGAGQDPEKIERSTVYRCCGRCVARRVSARPTTVRRARAASAS